MDGWCGIPYRGWRDNLLIEHWGRQVVDCGWRKIVGEGSREIDFGRGKIVGKTGEVWCCGGVVRRWLFRRDNRWERTNIGAHNLLLSVSVIVGEGGGREREVFTDSTGGGKS